MNEETTCVICQKLLVDDVVTLREKGSEGINRASAERNDIIMAAVPGQKVHQTCCRAYCHPINIAPAKKQENTSAPTSSSRRSLDRKTEHSFSFKTDCFFCGTRIDFEEQKKRPGDVFRVTTLETKDTVLEICSEREDLWAEVVQARILHVHDSVAADAVYHQACSVNFRTKKQIPKLFASDEPDHKKRKIGRPQDEEKNDAFLKVAKFLQDNVDKQITVLDLVEKMEEFLGDSGSAAYSRTHMKARLQEHFGNQIMITDTNGKPNFVTFRSNVTTILHEFHTRQKMLILKRKS